MRSALIGMVVLVAVAVEPPGGTNDLVVRRRFTAPNRSYEETEAWTATRKITDGPRSRSIVDFERQTMTVLDKDQRTYRVVEFANLRAQHVRAVFHRRPLVNGYTGYWPAGVRERMALVRRLPEPDALAALRNTTGLELILVHTSLFGAIERELCHDPARWGMVAERCVADPGAGERAAWLTAARDGRADLRLVASHADDLVFAVSAR